MFVHQIDPIRNRFLLQSFTMLSTSRIRPIYTYDYFELLSVYGGLYSIVMKV